MSTTPTEMMETIAATEEVLDIASIKELMDGFDPASLLPQMSDVFGSIVTLCRFAVMVGPVVLLAMGLAYLLFSPKEANYYFGYRCYFGMGSVQAWRFTQRLAGVVLGGIGLILTIFMYLSSSSFAGMDVTEMVWKCVDYLVIQAALALVATLAINLTAMLRFNHRGEYRKAVKAKNAKE